jgi:hypothetical protein
MMCSHHSGKIGYQLYQGGVKSEYKTETFSRIAGYSYQPCADLAEPTLFDRLKKGEINFYTIKVVLPHVLF